MDAAVMDLPVAATDDRAKQDFTAEVAEWLEAFDQVVKAEPAQGAELLGALRQRASETGVAATGAVVTPYRNTIRKEDEVPYPGDRQMERRLESLLRWNAMAMVHSQNKKDAGIGGHISTYSSQATLLEVGFNHFFRAKYGKEPGDFIYFQGHASPGVYARAYLEGRFDEARLKNFRHELRGEPGLSSYPHPWLMPEFWNFPTVSMGIGPLNAIYQARFMRYLENRGLIQKTERKVWGFLGDGETDEVDTLGAISLGAREKLDNLIFVVNCNLQRLDGPVRGNASASSMSWKGCSAARAGMSSRSSGARTGMSSLRATQRVCCSSAWKSASMATSRPSRRRTARTCAPTSSASIRSCWRW